MENLHLLLGIFGLLLTAIGVLVFARLVFVSSEIKDLWTAIGKITDHCREEAGIIGYLKGRVNGEKKE